MKVGRNETVDVRISKSLLEDLNAELEGSVKLETRKLRVGPYMGVTLSGTDGFFKMDLKNREQNASC